MNRNSRYDRQDDEQDDVFWTGNDLKDVYLYEHLVKTAGTEVDIRKRQQLFITKDMINNEISRYIGQMITDISSGSLAEVIDLPGSDMDIMYVIKNVDIIRDVRNIKHSVQRTTLVMENDNDHPGFTRLRLAAGGDGESSFIQPNCFESTRQGVYLSVNSFVDNINSKLSDFKLSSHGPCLSDKNQQVDNAFCLRSKYLPYNALPWASRHRLQWPPNYVIDKIKNYGCLLVPIGPRTLPDCNILWRLSFSLAEKQLVHSFNFTQLLCYCLLKLTLKHIVNANKDAEGLLCSYFLKTALFWVSEEVDIDTFHPSKLYSCFYRCLSRIILWVNKCYCPNYFIPEHNMFLGKINADNNKILIDVLHKIKCDGIHGLINSLFQYENEHHRLLSTQLEPSFIKLDLLFYRTYNWLLYASFYYVTGQFTVTLRLTDSGLSRCLPDMITIGCPKNYDQKINYYRNHVHATMTLQEKMKIAAIQNVAYLHHSSLIPEELQLEVHDYAISIPPIVMSHCLKFLCYHHVGDVLNRQKALRDLFSTVKQRNLIDSNALSISLTILGICFEISDDKDTAYMCYETALQCDGYICTTAGVRRSNLLTDFI